MGRRLVRAVPAALILGAAGAVLPSVADAHGLVGRADIPVPVWLFAWAAAMVLVLSFAALALLWPKPRLQRTVARRVLPLPPAVDVVLGALGVAVFAVVLYAGLAGEQGNPLANVAPTFVYVIFWVGGVVMSLLLGDVFRLLSPWRAIARAVAWLAGRAVKQQLPAPLVYPSWLGRWPAALTIAGFAWVELAYVNKDRPSTLALLALGYMAVQLVGMSLFGIEPWSGRADGFGVYFGFFARISPWVRRDGVLCWHPPLAGVAELEPSPGAVAMLCVMIGSTTFDGVTNGPLWNDVLGSGLRSDFLRIGMTADTALEASFTVGLLACILLAGSLYRLGILGMRFAGGTLVEGGEVSREPTGKLALRFVHSLVPIAAAYAIAHYFSFLVYQGQSTAALVSDPLGHGSNLLGTAHASVDYNLISATGIWYVQVGALVLGHVAGLVLAHDRAIAVYQRSRDAVRSQGWMLAVMVGFTSLALFLISAANR